MKLNEIHHGDCLELMKGIPSKSIDLIVIDPPYNIGKDKRWDKYKKDEYIEFMGAVFKECERTLKENGSFYWFHNDMVQIKDLMTWLEDNTGFIYKQFIVWNKRFEGASLKGYLDGHVSVGGLRNFKAMAEYCLFYTSENTQKSWVQINREKKGLSTNDVDILMGKVRTKNPNRGTELCRRWEEGNSVPNETDFYKLCDILDVEYDYKEMLQDYKECRYTFNNQRTHHSVWEYEVAPKLGHVTPKPVELVENILRHSSNPGDVVLDCFIGSGTTAVASLNTGRQFIGIEKEKEYVDIANERIKSNQLVVDLS